MLINTLPGITEKMQLLKCSREEQDILQREAHLLTAHYRSTHQEMCAEFHREPAAGKRAQLVYAGLQLEHLLVISSKKFTGTFQEEGMKIPSYFGDIVDHPASEEDLIPVNDHLDTDSECHSDVE